MRGFFTALRWDEEGRTFLVRARSTDIPSGGRYAMKTYTHACVNIATHVGVNIATHAGVNIATHAGVNVATHAGVDLHQRFC
jgi:hypothetical protein